MTDKSLRQRRLARAGTYEDKWDAPVEIESHHRVTTPELFSDLVLVVAIHMVGLPVEKSESLFTDGTLVSFILRMFVLWFTWHINSCFTNIAHFFCEGDDHLRPVHYVFVFGCVMCSAFMAQSCNRNNDRSFVFFFGVSLVLVTIAWFFEARRAKPHDMTEQHYNSIRKAGVHMAGSLIINLPLMFAVAWYADPDTGTASSTSIAWWVACALHILLARYGWAVKCTEPRIKILDEESFQERYELITLILIGELLFASATPGLYVYTASTVGFAACCFLLMFTKANGRRDAWGGPWSGIMNETHAYYGLFCVLPCFGASLSRIIEESHESRSSVLGSVCVHIQRKERSHLERRISHADESHIPNHESVMKHFQRFVAERVEGECVAPTLLVTSVASFLLFSALVVSQTRDSTELNAAPRHALKIRVAVRIVGACLSLGALCLSCDAGPTVVTMLTLMVLATVYELWAVQPAKVPSYELCLASQIG